MEIKVLVKNKKELFERYLEFLNPILNLREQTELPLLSAFLSLHYSNNSYSPDTLSSLLFSEDTKNFIRGNLKISEKSFNKSFKNLQEKGMITDNKINPLLTQYPKDNKFKLNISFIEDSVNKQ